MRSKTIKNMYYFGKKHIVDPGIKTWVVLDIILLAIIIALTLAVFGLNHAQ